MQEIHEEVPMVHYQCYTCHITATCVATPSASLAWFDHMDTHAVKDNFGCWVWYVQSIPFDRAGSIR